MILRKKHLPKQLHMMWYSSLLNFSLGIFNSVMYVTNDNLFTLVTAIIMICISVGLVVLFNKLSREILWNKLMADNNHI